MSLRILFAHPYTSQRIDIPKRSDQPPRALIGLGRRFLVAGGSVSTLFGSKFARGAASFSFGVALLGERGRAALVAQRGDVDLEAIFAAGDFQRIADVYQGRGFAGRLVELDLAAFD